MTKRKLTQNAVAQITQSGAPATSSGNAASCALPPYTSTVIATAAGTDKPLLTIATPVTSPHAAMPSDGASMSRKPRRNSGSRTLIKAARLAKCAGAAAGSSR